MDDDLFDDIDDEILSNFPAGKEEEVYDSADEVLTMLMSKENATSPSLKKKKKKCRKAVASVNEDSNDSVNEDSNEQLDEETKGLYLYAIYIYNINYLDLKPNSSEEEMTWQKFPIPCFLIIPEVSIYLRGTNFREFFSAYIRGYLFSRMSFYSTFAGTNFREWGVSIANFL